MAKQKHIKKGGKVRVLVVDDSVVIRRLVSHALEQTPSFEIVGNAANGAIALKMIPLTKPDVVTLDIEMPEMDGLETLREIRRLYPDLFVIMFSTLTERGAMASLQALTMGANDYVAKVANVGSLDKSMARLREELIPKLKQFFIFEDAKPAVPEVKVAQTARFTPAAPVFRRTTTAATSGYQAVAIGVSTGGPNALAEVVPMFSDTFSLPILIVQHMPPLFTRFLAERLQRLTKLSVREASHGMTVESRNIYVAPGDYHMRVARVEGKEILTLDQQEPENSCRPAVDVLFRSVVETYGGQTIAAILTGMGQDGKLGAECIRGRGGYVIAQDQKSSVVWGMPGAVVQAGLANTVVDLKNIVPEIEKLI